MINKALKMAMYEKEEKYKEIAEEMGINGTVFKRKINHNKVNGYVARFTVTEKKWLADKFGVDITEIE